MKRTLYSTVLIAFAVVLFVWQGCSRETGLLDSDSNPVETLGKAGGAPSLDVNPVFRVPTGRKAERLTVFVFFAKGGKGGGKPPKDDGRGESCSDPNSNSAFAEIGVRWLAPGIPVLYQPAFEPDAVVGMALGTVDAAFSTWETAVGNAGLFNFSEDLSAPLPPERDGVNVVGWRQLVGRDAKRWRTAWAYVQCVVSLTGLGC